MPFFGELKFVGVHFEIFVTELLRDAPLNLFHKLLPGETLCKFCQIFPPKDLVYRGRKQLSQLLIS